MLEKPRILAADVPSGHSTLRKVLGDVVVLVPATTIEEALSALGEGLDGIVCGIHFDDSRMFDLLRMAKTDVTTRSVPIVCYRELESELSPTLFESLGIACRALGADTFVDLYTLREKLGSTRADEEFRRLVFASLSADQS